MGKEMEELINLLKTAADFDNRIESIVVIGSYARGTHTEESDIDLCIITTEKEALLKDYNFFAQFGMILKMQTEYYGACTSVRVWYKNGSEVEFGIVEPSWIRSPLDCGTHRVLCDGYKVIIDKKSYFSDLRL